jgi:predicted  nucleic acid-binding Zn-ribbon protein
MDKEAIILDEIKELSKGITEILVAIGKIETEVRQISTLAGKLDSTEKTVVRLETDLATAFRRIDELRGQVKELEGQIDSDRKAVKEDRKWLWGAGVAAVALFWNLFGK